MTLKLVKPSPDAESVYLMTATPALFEPGKGFEFDKHVGCDPGSTSDASYDLAVLRFGDDGIYDPNEAESIKGCIETAANRNPFGTIVVVFVHGWTHSASWADEHFASFRNILGAYLFRRWIPLIIIGLNEKCYSMKRLQN